MKYFLDTEFIEGTQKSIFNTKPTIDLISIGIVCEDGREYYSISKDFNLKEAWNRYDLVRDGFKDFGMTPNYKKVYWIRDNVLKPIYEELLYEDYPNSSIDKLTYNNLKNLINKYGKTNKQIAEEIIEFCTVNENRGNGILEQINNFRDTFNRTIQFYGYYSDYDWVVFCWLFGKMIDLPKGFPMYCIDLKQELSRKQSEIKDDAIELDRRKNYPKQTNEHNALADAIFCRDLYYFLNNL